jgi:thymidylate kinase
MITLIEGPRLSGKSFLLDKFFEQNTDPNTIYYKFLFAKYLQDFDIKKYDDGPGVHYFSIANVITILELNKTLLKDKNIIFDRCIFSAYVWSIYRNRLPKTELMQEFNKILSSDLFEDCQIIYLTRPEYIKDSNRNKDYFDQFQNYEKEKSLFDDIFSDTSNYINSNSKRTKFIKFTNNFDDLSIQHFCNLLNK